MVDISDLRTRMAGSITALENEFAGLRTGRAHIGLLDNINVDAYGSSMPLSQVGTVGAPEARLLTVQVWDKTMVKAVEKAITEANLGLNPSPDGQLIRVPLPELSEERRKELVKIAGKYAEQARVSVRNVRRDGMESLKKSEKDGDISQDKMHSGNDEVQKLTDEFVGNIDDMVAKKESDIMTV